MLYAITDSGEKRKASPHVSGLCPGCLEEVISKCGDIKQWHWAHRADSACDIWHEHETAWHLTWKENFPARFCEVPLVLSEKKHIADVHLPGRATIEFQHSPISIQEIRDRECFYRQFGEMYWIVDVNDSSNFYWMDDPENKDLLIFNWKYAKKSICYAKEPVFLDFNDGFLLEILKIFHGASPLWESGVNGRGILREKDSLLKWFYDVFILGHLFTNERRS